MYREILKYISERRDVAKVKQWSRQSHGAEPPRFTLHTK